MKATVVGVRYLPGDYGTTQLITFNDEQGRVLTWFSSREQVGPDPQVALREGDTLHLSATVKANETFRGEDQTVITRGKISFE